MPQSNGNERIADNLSKAYVNFNPSKTLNPDSIFLIDQASVNRGIAERALSRQIDMGVNKWFLIGHRGSGKSTFLRRLLASNSVIDNYIPILFRISDVVDMGDLGYQELLLAIAVQMVEYAERNQAITTPLRRRLNEWGRTVIEESSSEQKAGVDVEGGIGAYFAKFMVKLQTQYTTRKQFRHQIEPQITELINIIDDLSAEINTKLGKPPLIAIDDIDKASVSAAKSLFGDHWSSINSPQCYFIFTVPVSLMHESEWQNIKDNCWNVPNVKIFNKSDRTTPYPIGVTTIKELIFKRMQSNLISEEALDKVILYGGGVLRQTCIIVQTASDRAEAEGLGKIDVAHVDQAVSEQTNSMIPQLTDQDMSILLKVSQDNDSQIPFENPRLLHNLSLLLYPNSRHWHDVNPLLWSRLDEYKRKSIP
jgi:GTPase SAR1 family protein